MSGFTTPAIVETQNYVETASESDEETTLYKSTSPMSITSEVISDGVDKKNNERLLEIEFQTKSNEL